MGTVERGGRGGQGEDCVRARVCSGRDKGRREDEGRGMVPVSCMFAVIIFFWFFGCKNLVWFIYSTLDRV